MRILPSDAYARAARAVRAADKATGLALKAVKDAKKAEEGLEAVKQQEWEAEITALFRMCLAAATYDTGESSSSRRLKQRGSPHLPEMR